jgi:hypothetical protein
VSAGYPTRAGRAAGASGLFTLTIIKPETQRDVAEHWAYDERAQALEELGMVLERVTPGTELVLRDPEGVELMRVAKLA